MVVQKQEGNLPERFPTRPQQQAQGVEVEEEAEEGEAQEAIGVAATEERRDESDRGLWKRESMIRNLFQNSEFLF